MATNKPAGANARKGTVRKRTQLKGKLQGEPWTKRDKTTGEFMAMKKKNKFKGVRRESRLTEMKMPLAR